MAIYGRESQRAGGVGLDPERRGGVADPEQFWPVSLRVWTGAKGAVCRAAIWAGSLVVLAARQGGGRAPGAPCLGLGGLGMDNPHHSPPPLVMGRKN